MDEQRHAMIPSPPVIIAKPLPGRRSLWAILWHTLSAVDATPPPPPDLPPDLAELPPVPRLYECVRLFLLDVEQALSPGGQLRGLARWACRICVAVGILALCLGFVLACVSAVLAVIVIATGQLVVILWNLVEAALLVLALLALGFVLLLVVRTLTA